MDATVARKDEFSVEHFGRLYGVEFGPDPAVFDLVLARPSFQSRGGSPIGHFRPHRPR
jgi:hypothetical protein